MLPRPAAEHIPKGYLGRAAVPRRCRAVDQEPRGAPLPSRLPVLRGRCYTAPEQSLPGRRCSAGQRMGFWWARRGGWRSRRGTAGPGAPLRPLSLRPSRLPRCAQSWRRRSGAQHWALPRFSRLSSLVIAALPEPATASSFLALAIFSSPSRIDQSTAPAVRARLHRAAPPRLRLAGPSCEWAGADPAGRGIGVPGACPPPAPSSRPPELHRTGRARDRAAGARRGPDCRTRRAEVFLSNKCTFLFLKQKYRFRLNNSRISLNEAFAYFPVLIGCIINSPDPALYFQ